MASCERTVILEHNRQSLDFREEISTMGTGRFYDDRQSARRFGKTTKFVGNCGDVMRCPVNLDLNIQNYQRLTIFATSTHKDRLLHLCLQDFCHWWFFVPGHWFDPLVWPSRITRVDGSKRNVSWIWKLWVTLLNVSMLTWSASFCLENASILRKLNWSHIWICLFQNPSDTAQLGPFEGQGGISPETFLGFRLFWVDDFPFPS